MKKKEKYTLVTISGIHSKISLKTKTKGYSIAVIEVLFPTDKEIEKWSDKQSDKWIFENNKRMESICKFLNENNL